VNLQPPQSDVHAQPVPSKSSGKRPLFTAGSETDYGAQNSETASEAQTSAPERKRRSRDSPFSDKLEVYLRDYETSFDETETVLLVLRDAVPQPAFYYDYGKYDAVDAPNLREISAHNTAKYGHSLGGNMSFVRYIDVVTFLSKRIIELTKAKGMEQNRASSLRVRGAEAIHGLGVLIPRTRGAVDKL
jgi:hypothetical protein